MPLFQVFFLSLLAGVGCLQQYFERASFIALNDPAMSIPQHVAAFEFDLSLKSADYMHKPADGSTNTAQSLPLTPQVVESLLEAAPVVFLGLSHSQTRSPRVDMSDAASSKVFSLFGAPDGLWLDVVVNGSVSSHSLQSIIEIVSSLMCTPLSSTYAYTQRGRLLVSTSSSPLGLHLPAHALPFIPTTEHTLLSAWIPTAEVCTDSVMKILSSFPCGVTGGVAELANEHSRRILQQGGALSARLLNVNGSMSWQARLQFTALDSFTETPTIAALLAANASHGVPVRKCALATNSAITALSDTSNQTSHDLTKSPLDVASWRPIEGVYAPHRAEIRVQRFVTDISLRAAVLTTAFINEGSNAVVAVYQLILPWYFTPVLSSQRAFASFGSDQAVTTMPLHTVRYDETKHSPRVITYELQLQPGAELSLQLDLRFEMLHSDDYPPDASRGMDLPSSVVYTYANDTLQQVVFTPSHVVDIPQPDFSMPYNAMTLVSTALLFLFGSVLNALTRKPKPVHQVAER